MHIRCEVARQKLTFAVYSRCYVLGLCSDSHWLCLVSFVGQYSIYFINGANELVTLSDLMSAAPLVQKSKVMACNMELGQPVVMAAMKMAKEHGCKFQFAINLPQHVTLRVLEINISFELAVGDRTVL